MYYPDFSIAECSVCGRRQSYLGDEQMESIGWRKINGEWECPFCTGNDRMLERRISRDSNEDGE